jgi:hypothetical protein
VKKVLRILLARSLVHREVQALAPAGNVCQIQPQSDAKGKASQRQDKQPRTSIKQTGEPQSDAKGKASQRQDKQPRTSIKQTGVDVR